MCMAYLHPFSCSGYDYNSEIRSLPTFYRVAKKEGISRQGMSVRSEKEYALFKFLFNRARDIIDENRRAYILINIVYYGLIVLAMIYVAFNQPLQIEMLKTANEKLMTGALAMIG